MVKPAKPIGRGKKRGIEILDPVQVVNKNNEHGIERKKFKVDWKAIEVTKKELDIDVVLIGGQSFRWKRAEENFIDDLKSTDWVGVFSRKVWFLRQEPTQILYKVIEAVKESDEVNYKLLKDYFQLDVSLSQLYAEWSEKDKKFAEKVKDGKLKGIRVLNQNPVEALFAFICSANNNITRITSMVEKLASTFGDEIVEIEGTKFYDFPKIENFIGNKKVQGVEEFLKKEKFGYRAGYISKTAELLFEMGGEDHLNSLKKMTFEEARTELMKFQGVGRKVADCVCLMSLGFNDAVPIDVHMHNLGKIALPHLAKEKTLTEKGYYEISNHFRSVYGKYAGWAQAVVFTDTMNDSKAKRGRQKK